MGMQSPGRLWRAAWLVLAVLGTCAALVTCGAKKDPIEALLADIEEAAEDRDAQGVVDHLAPEFVGMGRIGRADALVSLRRYFAAYESVNLTIYGVEIDRDEDASEGHVRFQVDFDGRPLKIGALSGFLPPSAMYRFDLQVRAEEGKESWLVSGGTWEELALKAGEE